MVVSLIGLLVSILVFGTAVIGRRGQLATRHPSERVREVETNVGREVDRQSVGVALEFLFFKGVCRGFALYGEKSTADILAMVRAG